MGVLGCVSCIVGSVVIVIHAPKEQTPNSVQEIWTLATQPGTFLYCIMMPSLQLVLSETILLFFFPAFLVYVAITMSVVLALILHFEPLCGQSNILVYIGICSLMGALTVSLLLLSSISLFSCLFVSLKVLLCFQTKVMSIKAIGIAIKLTMEGVSQIGYPQTWLFLMVAVTCVVTQLIYLNKVSYSPLNHRRTCVYC